MTIKVTSTARGYHPSKVRSRYVRLSYDDKFRWCEVGADRSVDLRQGLCEEEDLPVEIIVAARERRAAGVWPFYIEWPL